MNMLWIVTGASLLVALLAWNRARRTARRLEQLSQMYWELKYQHGELRVQVQRLTGEGPRVSSAPPSPPPTDSFIPLTSLKR
jgi:hypothetical protein